MTRPPLTNDNLLTREVWGSNLDEELAIIRNLIDEYSYIAMDTEFPGVVRFAIIFRVQFPSPWWHMLSLPLSTSAIGRSSCRYVQVRLSISNAPVWRRLDCFLSARGKANKLELNVTTDPLFRCNVDLLKLIQLGITLTDGDGNLPLIAGHYCVWQFNFREFDLKEDMYAQDSIELLKHSGIDFDANRNRGIDVHRFGELLMVSGVVLNQKVV